MDWEILIPILMFLIPFVLSILDKRARKRKGVPPVKARPVNGPVPFPSGPEGPGARPVERPVPQDPSQPYGWAPPSYDAEGGTVPLGRLPNPSQKTTEGERAIVKREEKKVLTEESESESEPEPKLEIDKKKLILYSEILKPKFDN